MEDKVLITSVTGPTNTCETVFEQEMLIEFPVKDVPAWENEPDK